MRTDTSYATAIRPAAEAADDYGVPVALVEKIRATSGHWDGARQVVYHDGPDDAPQSAAWWRARNIRHREQNIDALYRDAVTDVSAVHEWVLSALTDPTTAPWLLFVGPVGTGKTYAAYAALRLMAESARDLCWQAYGMGDLLERLRPGGDLTLQQVKDAPVLLLDDLGTTKGTEWAHGKAFDLIDDRYRARRPTILTTNLLPEEVAENLGDRVADRIDQASRPIVLDGPSLRETNLWWQE